MTLFAQLFVKHGNVGQNNIEESKTLSEIFMKPRANVEFKGAFCWASEVSKRMEILKTVELADFAEKNTKEYAF